MDAESGFYYIQQQEVMIRVLFKVPEVIEQEGIQQELSFVDCIHINSMNDYKALVYVSDHFQFPVSFKNILHIEKSV